MFGDLLHDLECGFAGLGQWTARRVFDRIGNEVQRQVINRRSADAVFSIGHDLAPGLYIIQLLQGDVTRSVRWVVR